MNFSLAIIFLWLGCALLVVAFHPLSDASATSPGAVIGELQTKIGTAVGSG